MNTAMKTKNVSIVVVALVVGATLTFALWSLNRAVKLERNLSVIEEGDFTLTFVLSINKMEKYNSAINGLVGLGPYAVPALIKVLEKEEKDKDPFSAAPILASMVLAEIGHDASQAVPILTKLADKHAGSILYSNPYANYGPSQWQSSREIEQEIEQMENSYSRVYERLRKNVMKAFAHAAIAEIGENTQHHVDQVVFIMKEILQPISERQVGSGRPCGCRFIGQGRFRAAYFVDPEDENKFCEGIDMMFIEIVNAAMMVGSALGTLDGNAKMALPLLEREANEATRRGDEFCASIYNVILEDVKWSAKMKGVEL